VSHFFASFFSNGLHQKVRDTCPPQKGISDGHRIGWAQKEASGLQCSPWEGSHSGGSLLYSNAMPALLADRDPDRSKQLRLTPVTCPSRRRRSMGTR
jgi:hypothetical protein